MLLASSFNLFSLRSPTNVETQNSLKKYAPLLGRQETLLEPPPPLLPHLKIPLHNTGPRHVLGIARQLVSEEVFSRLRIQNDGWLKRPISSNQLELVRRQRVNAGMIKNQLYFLITSTLQLDGSRHNLKEKSLSYLHFHRCFKQK